MTADLRVRVLALAAYPAEAAATRYRLVQHQEGLRRHGIELRIRPFISARTFTHLYDHGRTARARTAVGLLAASGRASVLAMRPGPFDVLLVQREAALLGPPLLESVLVRRGAPLILDIDDAIYLQPSGSTRPVWSGLRAWPNKIDRLVELASLVTCGSEAIRDHAVGQGKRALHVPNVLDSDRWAATRPRPEGKVTVGWVGTHSSFPYLKRILPSLEAAARTRPFRLVVVGSGERELTVPGVEVVLRRWSLEREVADFQEIDIGLYPIDDDAWGQGKSALKSVQYLMTGTPFIASPVGEASALGLPGVTHLTASDHTEWEANLTLLLDSPDLRGVMGDRGRSFAVEHLSVDVAQNALVEAITSVAGLAAQGGTE